MTKTAMLPSAKKSISVATHVYPANIFMRLVLPAPEGPMMAVSSPALNSPFTFRRIITFPASKRGALAADGYVIVVAADGGIICRL